MGSTTVEFGRVPAKLATIEPFGEVYARRLNEVMGRHDFGPLTVTASDLIVMGCHLLSGLPDRPPERGGPEWTQYRAAMKAIGAALAALGFEVTDRWNIMEYAEVDPVAVATAFPCHGEVLDLLADR